MSKTIAIPFEFLRTISSDNQSGCFVIADSRDNSVSWKLYVNGSYVSYGTSAVGQKERLNCLWEQFKSEQKVIPSVLGNLEYEELCNWWVAEKLPIPHLQQLLLKLSQETFAQILAIEKTSIEFLPNDYIKQPLIRHSWQDLFEQSQTLIQQWQEIRLYLPSPFSRLYLNPQKMYDFYQFWKQLNKKPETFKKGNERNVSLWLQLLSQKKCLYEIATDIGIIPLTLIEVLLPLIKSHVIEVLPFQDREYSPSSSERGGDGSQPVQISEKETTNSVAESITKTPNPIIPAQGKVQSVKTETNPAVISQLQHNLSISASEQKSIIKPIVACIDDSKTVQKQVQITLEAAGYKVLSITEPTSTLTILVRQKPVLILLDINMPEIDGYELCQMLNRSRKLRDIPIVMLTGRDGMIDRLRARLVGATHYLTKPFDPNQLIEIVQRLALQKL